MRLTALSIVLWLVACTTTTTETVLDPVTGEVRSVTTTEKSSDINWNQLAIEVVTLAGGLLGLNVLRNRSRRQGKHISFPVDESDQAEK